MSCFIRKEQKYPWNLDKMEMWKRIPFTPAFHLLDALYNGFTLFLDYLQTLMKYQNF